WEAASGRELRRWTGSTPASGAGAVGVQRLDFSPVAMHIAASDNNVVNIWDADTGQRLATLTGHKGAVWAVAYSPDGRYLATGSVDGGLRIWDAATGALLHELIGHTNAVEGVAFSPDGKRLASAGDDQSARIWDTATGQLLQAKTDFDSPLYTVTFSPDGAR